MRKKYDYIVFDLDGTLLDVKEKFYWCYSKIVEKLGKKPIDIEQYWELRRKGYSGQKILEVTEMKELSQMFLREWIRMIESKEALQCDKLFAGTQEVLRSLKQRQIQLVLVTMRHNIENLMTQLQLLEIGTYFDEIIAAGDKDISGKESLFPVDIEGRGLAVGDTLEDEKFARYGRVDFLPVNSGLRVWNNGIMSIAQLLEVIDESMDESRICL